MNTKKIFFAAFFAIITTAMAISVYSFKVTTERTVLIFPKGSTYEKEWTRVDSLVGQGLNKSALEQVEKIYEKAKKENNAPQSVKAIMHRLKLERQIEENSVLKSLNKLNDEIAGSSYPLTPVLHSMIADLYNQYYNQNRWQFYNRSQTVNFKMDDISTWDLKTLFDQIIKHHTLALKSTDSLQRTPLNIYDDVLQNGNDETRKLRPTLYDFVAHRALDFLMNDEPDVIRPAYKFELNSADYFSQYDQFSKLKIESKDSLSTKYYAAKILQELLVFHASDNDPVALIDADLKRLTFVKNHAITGINDSLYLQALETLEKKFIKHHSSTEITHDIANVYYTRGMKYDGRKSEENKWMLKKAYDICEAGIKRFSEYSFGQAECQGLQSSIKQKNIAFTVEKANDINKPFRSYVTYHNIKKLYFRVAEISYEQFVRKNDYYTGYNTKDVVKSFCKLKPIKEWSVDMPNDGDYQTHYTEVKIPQLPAGHYIILACDSTTFDVDKNGIAYSNAWSTNLSFIDRKTKGGGYDYYVLDRQSGSPVKGATLNLWMQNYNYTARKYEFKKYGSYTTNTDGYVSVPPPVKDNYTYFEAEIINGKDRFHTESSFYMYRERIYAKEMYPQTFFFTDRAIYRPGQTIYFKGVMVKTDGKKSEILPNHTAVVTFFDVNSQKIASLTLTTNEYGSFDGTFTAPNGVLNGQMFIQETNGSVYFSVEDYKRPKFEVAFNPVKGTFRLGDDIKVEGFAKAYAGSNIDGAQVKYRVVRNAVFPYWWWYWWGYYPSSPQMEITNGVATTNDTGGFFINFKALADLSVPKSSAPTFAYTIYADVTDINGETHSSQSYVNVAYTALNLGINFPSEVNKEKEQKFPVSTTNTNGVFEPAQGKIEVYKLKDPGKVFRKREWQKADKFVMSKEEYYAAFPVDVYDDENNMYKWNRGERVFDASFDTEKNKELSIGNLNSWKPGVYVMEAHSKDKFGEDVKDIKYFTVFSEKEKSVPSNNPDWFNIINASCEPGEKAAFVIGSRDTAVKVLYEVEEDGAVVKKEWLKLNNEQKRIEIPVEEKNRGGLAFHCVFIKNGRQYNHSSLIDVPWTNKELDISFETFRDKLQPGQKEEWKMIIKDKKGQKMAAEMLATMYDASLDVFKVNNWFMNLYQSYYMQYSWTDKFAFGTKNSALYYESPWNSYYGYPSKYYDQLNWFGYYFYYYGYYGKNRGGYENDDYGGISDITIESTARMSAPKSKDENREMPDEDKSENKKADKSLAATGAMAATTAMPPSPPEVNDPVSGERITGKGKSEGQDLSKVSARTNFSETAFFYPHIQTDANGNLVVKFTIPEALTRWKMMGLAYTKDLKVGQITKELVTQKDLMVMPNAPRFFRENDKMEFTAKVSNLSDKDLSGSAQIFFFDAMSMKDITTQLMKDVQPQLTFSAKKGQSAALAWNITIPEGFGAITYKVVAKANNFSDGEEMALPVLTNSMLVTESMPLPIRSKQTKKFTFEKFVNQNNHSTTLRNHKLTLEFTSNPAWYAVQALPYLMEYPYECAEQTFSRFYANSIASHIANSSPKIKAVFDSWKSSTPDALLSNLEKNQELKSLMLEETPWVLDAKDETERKKRVALLFDMNKMANELERSLIKLQKMQVSNGAWPWFEGGPDDRYITQYIVTGMGHLDHLGVKNIREDTKVWGMTKQAVRYLDERVREDYESIMKYGHPELDNLGYLEIEYLYARSYFKDVKIADHNQKAFDYFKGQAQKFWLNKGRYMEGMIALALNRYDDKIVPMKIMKSLKENSLNNEEMGMYWKENYEGYYWYEAPIEAQALLIEAFDEVSNDKKAVDDLKVWLLKSKQTQDWKTTKATTEACYALLLRGTDWLATESQVEITMGDVKIDPKTIPDVKQEAGTGYFKTSWSGSDIKPSMGNVTVVKKDEGVSWGAVYWQYFEQLDKITPHKTPLSIIKKLFVERNTESGPVIELIDDKTKLKVGDKLKVRIELRVDRDAEYVHMKDMRASGFDPLNVISRYKWQDGLGYYESTRDAATNFFFNYLRKGTYVFEYPLRVTHNGDFSNGITTIQCMYAPEFTSHSEGLRVKIGK